MPKRLYRGSNRLYKASARVCQTLFTHPFLWFKTAEVQPKCLIKFTLNLLMPAPKNLCLHDLRVVSLTHNKVVQVLLCTLVGLLYTNRHSCWRLHTQKLGEPERAQGLFVAYDTFVMAC